MQEVKTTSERKGKASTWGNDHQIKSVQWSSGLTMTVLSSNATSKEFIRLESENECDNICSTISFHRLSIEAYQARMCCCIWNMQLTFQIQPLELDCMRKHVWICHGCSTWLCGACLHNEDHRTARRVQFRSATLEVIKGIQEVFFPQFRLHLPTWKCTSSCSAISIGFC